MNKQLTRYDKERFGGNREVTIQRDGEKCVKCFMGRDEHRKEFSRDLTVDHIDGNGRKRLVAHQNNDLANLRTLCLRCHGSSDGKRGGGRKPKLTEKQAINILHCRGESPKEVAKAFGLSYTTVYSILRGQNWKHLTNKGVV